MSYTINAELNLKQGRLIGAVRGVLTALTSQGEPMVDFLGNVSGRHLIATSTVVVGPDDIGKEAVLLFEDGDPVRPLLMGVVKAQASPPASSSGTVSVSLDGHRLILSASQEISLRCGEASITLTREGKVLIKGAYLLSKSTGPNRIKGGSVQLN